MPYFGVAMIVKDEVETIAATLASVRGAVDFVTVVDTGSTDGTQQAAAAALAGTSTSVALSIKSWWGEERVVISFALFFFPSG